MVFPVKAAIGFLLSILYKLKIVNFCIVSDSYEPFIVFVLVKSYKTLVAKIFYAGQKILFRGR